MSTKPLKFDFDEEKVEEKIIDFQRTMMAEEQIEIAGEMSKIIAQYIDIAHNTIRSFVSLAISIWQTTEKKQLKDINDESPEVRYQTRVEICKYFKKLLTELLRNKGQTEDLETAINAALKHFHETWANR